MICSSYKSTSSYTHSNTGVDVIDLDSFYLKTPTNKLNTTTTTPRTTISVQQNRQDRSRSRSPIRYDDIDGMYDMIPGVTFASMKVLLRTTRSQLYAGTVFDTNEADNWFQYCMKLPLESNPTSKLYGKEITMHRSVGFFSDASIGYKYSNRLFPSISFGAYPILLELLTQINKTFGTDYNGILINVYHNDNDYISQHADDEKDLDTSKKVISISLGKKRTFRVSQPKANEQNPVNIVSASVMKNIRMKEPTYDFTTEHGQMIIMDGDFQQEFHHGIPKPYKRAHVCDYHDEYQVRISLTFRHHKK